MKKKVPVNEAIGMVLPHDITEIRRGEFKGRAYKKGHLITAEDIEPLKRLGKDNIYVLELDEHTEIHENDAAIALASALAGPGVFLSEEAVEGKISLFAKLGGVLRVNREALYRFNMLGEVMCATLHGDSMVDAGTQVAATRLIPLVGSRDTVDKASEIARGCGGIIRVERLRKARVGLVITGNEVYYGRIEDSFEPVLRSKMERFGSELIKIIKTPDDEIKIAESLQECIDAGADLLITSGGMSVDPDDRTKAGIVRAGAEGLVYGTPVLPGAMFLSASIKAKSGKVVPVLGLPACSMYHKTTVLDLIIPRILSGEEISRSTVASLGYGGLCRNCKTCTYPVCPFGKG